MPNIELHGFAQKDVRMLRFKVRAALRASPIAGEIVTSVVPSDVENLAGDKMPFLRIICSPDELDDLVKRLEPLNVDIEALPLARWVPKRA